MAVSLREYRAKIRSVESTKKITRAMELIAASRIVKAQQRSEEHTSELQSRSDLVCRLLLEKKKNTSNHTGADQSSAPRVDPRLDHRTALLTPLLDVPALIAVILPETLINIYRLPTLPYCYL